MEEELEDGVHFPGIPWRRNWKMVPISRDDMDEELEAPAAHEE